MKITYVKQIICIPGKKGFSFSLIFSSCEKCFFLRTSFFLKTFSFKKTGCTMRTMVINIFSNISSAVKLSSCLPCINWRGNQIKLLHPADFRAKQNFDNQQPTNRQQPRQNKAGHVFGANKLEFCHLDSQWNSASVI